MASKPTLLVWPQTIQPVFCLPGGLPTAGPLATLQPAGSSSKAAAQALRDKARLPPPGSPSPPPLACAHCSASPRIPPQARPPSCSCPSRGCPLFLVLHPSCPNQMCSRTPFLLPGPADWLLEAGGPLHARINSPTSAATGHALGGGQERHGILAPKEVTVQGGMRSPTGTYEDRYATKIVRSSVREHLQDSGEQRQESHPKQMTRDEASRWVMTLTDIPPGGVRYGAEEGHTKHLGLSWWQGEAVKGF